MVGSRTLESAKTFTEKFGGQPVEGYEAVVSSPDVDAIYIGLPHHLHSEWTIRAAQAGKAILCEKPFTLTAGQAIKTLDEVKKHGVLFMEAFMYRCHPQTRTVLELVRSGTIGDVQLIQAEFGFHAPFEWDNFRAVNALGGGALMDVGCYPVSFARAVFNAEPTRVEYIARLGAKGYDEVGSGVLEFSEGRTLHFGTAVHLNLGNQATLYGTTGKIVIEDPWKVAPGKKVFIYKYGTPEPEILDLSSTNDELYGYEADAFAQFLGKTEVDYMTPTDTIENMKTLDALRHSAGFRFEGEELL